MEKSQGLPFKVGQLAESKSFIAGFRGAWFRCKIKGIQQRRGHIVHHLEFFDFPDEKITSTQIYQKVPANRVNSREERKTELMVRPRFPPCYRESQMPDVLKISEIVVISNDLWKSGDLVDWWFDGCYWSGRVTNLLGKDKVQIQLAEPPIGEGRSYEALCKDLRPSLNWSPENGWTVPASLENGTHSYCAHLVQPLDQERREDHSHHGIMCKTASCEVEQSSSLKRSVSSIPQAGFLCLPELGMPTKISCSDLGQKQTHMAPSSSKLNLEEGATRKVTGSEDSVTNVDMPGAMKETSSKQERFNTSQKPKNFGGNKQLMCLDTIESSVWALEELAIKIRWLKGMLKYGPQWSNPSWKFLEN